MTIVDKITQGISAPEEIYGEIVVWVENLLVLAENKTLTANISEKEKTDIIQALAGARSDAKIGMTYARQQGLGEEFIVNLEFIAKRFAAVRDAVLEGGVLTYNDFLKSIKGTLIGPISEVIKSAAPDAAVKLESLAKGKVFQYVL